MNPFGGSLVSNGYHPRNMINGAFDQSLEPTSVFGSSPMMKSSLLEYPFESDTGSISANIVDDLDAIDPLPVPISRRKRTRDSFENPSSSLGDGIDAPSLTRLTTQVSDWLQSFWPLGDERNRHKSMKTQPQLPPNSNIHYRQMQLQQQQQLQEQFSQQQQQQQRPMQPMDAQEIQQQLLLMAKNLSNLQQQIQSTQDDHSTITADQIQMQMEQLQRMSDSISNTRAPPAPPPPPPTLQANVSSTVFQLASTPSRLFAGLSAFFSDSKSSDLSQHGGNGRVMNRMDNAMTSTAGIGSGPIDNGINGVHSSGAQPMMESNNSASLKPPTLDMSTFDVGGDPFSDSATGANAPLPTFGRRSSGRSLLDDDDDD